MGEPAHVDLSGVRLDLLSRQEAVADLIRQSREEQQGGRYVCLLNAHLVSDAQHNLALREALKESYLNLPDGLPLVWLARRLGAEVSGNVRGADLMADLCNQGLQHSFRHVFYGSTPKVLGKLSDRLRERYPGILICDTISPPFRDLSPSEMDDMNRRITAARPDILWVGLGAPKQEIWARRHAATVHAKVTVAVGAAFEFHAGTRKQAPLWMQRQGLEWLYRFLQEPFRLAPRYIVGNTKFLVMSLRCLLERRSSPRSMSSTEDHG